MWIYIHSEFKPTELQQTLLGLLENLKYYFENISESCNNYLSY